ncbi:RagB/SusD family nutrient uptake outer membrane protein [Arenibacter sp. S6351L]|uniref:RagB/SusD family nutrient uptake outer membrane protein n=1 Tax=Arenibacter sp. S6351L TaxID=2926407 RepID=UPI001FF1B136|nr:RagB/SusD family nutrient uptake outer membrane protein [Arenibacter sp. S6351L]MCK0134894.1 RagB/SusD family nutrient uptake outer membrane protein [Arenibacter sp. S6351L]
MKKISKNRFKIIGVFVLFLLPLVSCDEEILDLNNPEQFTQATYFKTPEQIVQATNATYGSFFQFWIGSYQWPEIWDVLANETEATAGALGSYHEVSIIQMMGYQHNETNRTVENLWRMWYVMISRANLTIDTADAYLAENPSNDLVIRSRGEAYFLRGWAYFNLANYWGKVPIRLSFDQSENIDAPLANSVDEVWAVAENDLKEAQSVLKEVEDYGDTDLGRATKGSATGFLGKLYLTTGRYPEAEIELAKLEGHYDLLPAEGYLWNFGETNENNIESVFEFQSAYQEGDATTAMFTNVEGGPTPAMNNMQPQLHSWNGWPNWKFSPTREQAFLYQDESGTDFIDPRGAETFYGGVAGDDTWCDMCAENPNRPYDFAALGYYYKKKGNKEVKPSESGASAGAAVSGNNIRQMRYADVLLMRAECALMQGDPSGCIDFINIVRRRFGIFEYTPSNYSEAQAFELLKREREVEFMGEGSRFNDLKRWGILEETLNPEFQVIYGTQPVAPSHYFFEIPQNELDTNFGL